MLMFSYIVGVVLSIAAIALGTTALIQGNPIGVLPILLGCISGFLNVSLIYISREDY